MDFKRKKTGSFGRTPVFTPRLQIHRLKQGVKCKDSLIIVAAEFEQI